MTTAPVAILTDLYRARNRDPYLVDVPDLNFVMVDGRGDPNTSAEFADAIQALYGISYGARFALKRQGVIFKVMPLEALWGASPADLAAPREEWRWTAMIMQPDHVTAEVIESARGGAARKHPTAAVRIARFEAFREGLCAQVLHLGPYSEEPPTIERLHRFIADGGYRPHGRHHEIYLGDPRRSAPEKLKTLLRQPVIAL